MIFWWCSSLRSSLINAQPKFFTIHRWFFTHSVIHFPDFQCVVMDPSLQREAARIGSVIHLLAGFRTLRYTYCLLNLVSQVNNSVQAHSHLKGSPVPLPLLPLFRCELCCTNLFTCLNWRMVPCQPRLGHQSAHKWVSQ